jgi:hypothetical protein
MMTIEEYAEAMLRIFDSGASADQQAVAFEALKERTGVDTAFAEEAQRIVLAKLEGFPADLNRRDSHRVRGERFFWH